MVRPVVWDERQAKHAPATSGGWIGDPACANGYLVKSIQGKTAVTINVLGEHIFTRLIRTPEGVLNAVTVLRPTLWYKSTADFV